MNMFFNFAAASHGESSPSLFEALGIDAVLLLEQAIAFLILVALLAKFVYPALTRAIDNRRELIETSVKEAQATQDKAKESQSEINKLLADARKEADEIIARSHKEAQTVVAEAEAKAKTRADSFLKDAHTQLEADVAKARTALKKDTAELVAMATEKVIREKVDAKKDAKLIEGALQGSK